MLSALELKMSASLPDEHAFVAIVPEDETPGVDDPAFSDACFAQLRRAADGALNLETTIGEDVAPLSQAAKSLRST